VLEKYTFVMKEKAPELNLPTLGALAKNIVPPW